MDGEHTSGVDSCPLSHALLKAYGQGERNFSGTQWEKISVTGGDLSEAIFEGASFSDCILAGTKFNKSRLRGVCFSSCNLIQTQFIDCDLTEADFQPSALWKADFYHADLTRANLSQCNAKEACFIMARLVETKLDYASIGDSWFGMTVMNGVNLAFANVTGIEHRFQSIVDDQTMRSKGHRSFSFGDSH